MDTEIIPPESIDPAQLYAVLKATKGMVGMAAKALNRAGIQCTKEQLQGVIKNNPVLNAYFSDTSPVQHDLTLNEIEALNRGIIAGENPISEEELRQIVLSQQDELIMAKAKVQLGCTPEDIAEMDSLAALVGHGFKSTVDTAHGMAFVTMFRLQKRAREIEENILNCSETTERFAVSDGQLIKFDGPRFTDEEKLEWQKELRKIYEEIRKTSATFNEAAAIRQKAAELELRDKELHYKSNRKKVRTTDPSIPGKAGKGAPAPASKGKKNDIIDA